jgi:hypothetical protein
MSPKVQQVVDPVVTIVRNLLPDNFDMSKLKNVTDVFKVLKEVSDILLTI